MYARTLPGPEKTTLITWIFLRGWYPTSNTSAPPGFKWKQFGFRAYHATYIAIMSVVDKINNAVEENKTTSWVYLDLSKAFDKIDHNKL